MLLLDIRFEQQLYARILQGVPLNDLRDTTSLFVREIIAEQICWETYLELQIRRKIGSAEWQFVVIIGFVGIVIGSDLWFGRK